VNILLSLSLARSSCWRRPTRCRHGRLSLGGTSTIFNVCAGSTSAERCELARR
jgi:hypothetical protein